MPGIPAIAIGRTSEIVWGFTSSYVDTSDIWHEKLSFSMTGIPLMGRKYVQFLFRQIILMSLVKNFWSEYFFLKIFLRQNY